MLERVTSLTNTKTRKEAALFFVLHLTIAFILLFAVEYVLADYTSFHQKEGLSLSRGLAAVAVILYSLVLNCMLLVKKKLYKDFWYSFFVILSPVLAIWGLALAAFLTTRNVGLSADNVAPGTSHIVL